MRNYRHHGKRLMYSAYKTECKILVKKLKDGKITQKEFEETHDMLDDKYRIIR